MGTVSLYTFVAGTVPTASQWNQNPVAIAAAINGGLDETNADTASSDGLVGMSVEQSTSNSNPITGVKDFTGAIGLNGGVVVNEASADLDFRVESNDNAFMAYVDGAKNAVVFGANTDVSSADTPFLIDYLARTATAATNFDRFKVGGTNAVTVPAGTTALVTGAHIAEPNITATGTVTKATTLYVAGAPTEGSANYAFEVASGATLLSGTLTVGVDDTGYDVQLFGATAGAHLLWDESADTLKLVGGAKTDMQGTLTVGVNDTGYDVQLFGATAGKHLLWDESADTLKLVGGALLTVTGTVALDGGTFTYNTSEADLDFRFAGASDTNLLFGDAGNDRIYIGHNASVSAAGAAAKCEIHMAGNENALNLYRWIGSAGAPYLNLSKSRGTTVGSFTVVTSGDEIGNIAFNAADGTDLANSVALIKATVQGTVAGNRTPGQLSTYVATDAQPSVLTERLRIDKAGDTHTNDGTISSLSDSKAKKDPSPFTDGLDIIKQLNPINFKFNGMYSMTPDDNVSRMGFAADEVAKVAPYLTNEILEPVYEGEGENKTVIREDSVYTLNQIKMIPILVNAVKELSARIDAL